MSFFFLGYAEMSEVCRRCSGPSERDLLPELWQWLKVPLQGHDRQAAISVSSSPLKPIIIMRLSSRQLYGRNHCQVLMSWQLSHVPHAPPPLLLRLVSQSDWLSFPKSTKPILTQRSAPDCFFWTCVAVWTISPSGGWGAPASVFTIATFLIICSITLRGWTQCKNTGLFLHLLWSHHDSQPGCLPFYQFHGSTPFSLPTGVGRTSQIYCTVETETTSAQRAWQSSGFYLLEPV